MKSSLKYPDGKTPLASWIVSLMPSHLHYCEPYFGSGVVLFAKDPEGVSEVANDLNGELMNFWDVLRDPELFDRFRVFANLTPVSEAGWKRAYVGNEQRNMVEQALDFFIRIRQSLAARGHHFTALSKTRVRKGMNEQVAAWLSAVEGLTEVHERIKRVVLLCKPALDVIRTQDGPDTLFYLDPPYLHSTRETTVEYGTLEMSQEAHADLLHECLRCKGKVMISGYRSGLYDVFLDKWTRHEKKVANQREAEVLWCNYDQTTE